MDRVTLHEEYRLIEKTELEVNTAWKGAHLLLFFLAFVFGSFCTFCFHMLMYLFDEKCVLFPKLLSLTSFRQNIIYEFIPEDKDTANMLPVDFISPQWVEKSACLLPTYVPLVSGIFGLVWTTMFLMCSTGSRVLTGLQRPWRILPPIFIFSVAMSVLCIYTTTVTHYGLQELCLKLSEITGSPTCTYTVNVATLAYERRIRGVYQATRLTIFSAWLHTICWVLSAFLSLFRVLLAVDFKLIRISVQLQGNIDRMLEQHETHIRTVSPDTESNAYPRSKVVIHFKKKDFNSNYNTKCKEGTEKEGDMLYYSDITEPPSDLSLITVERCKLATLSACSTLPKDHQFIVKMLYNILNTIEGIGDMVMTTSSSSIESYSAPNIVRQYGQQRISSTLNLHSAKKAQYEHSYIDLQEADEIAQEIKQNLQLKLNKQLNEITNSKKTTNKESFESFMNIASDMKIDLQRKNEKHSYHPEPGTSKKIKRSKLKSNLKQKSIQTENTMKDKSLKVKINSETSIFSPNTSLENKNQTSIKNEETQTYKEKQE